MSIAINFGEVAINNELSSIKSPDPVIFQSNVNYFSYCITTTTMPMATKLGNVVTYYKNI